MSACACCTAPRPVPRPARVPAAAPDARRPPRGGAATRARQRASRRGSCCCGAWRRRAARAARLASALCTWAQARAPRRRRRSCRSRCAAPLAGAGHSAADGQRTAAASLQHPLRATMPAGLSSEEGTSQPRSKSCTRWRCDPTPRPAFLRLSATDALPLAVDVEAPASPRVRRGSLGAAAQVVVLPDSGGLVLALVAHSRFLLGLLVVEKEPPGSAARARGPTWQPQHAPPDPGAAGWPGGARGGAGGGAREAAGGASEGAGAGVADAALAPPAMSQFFTVRARSRAHPPGRVHAALRPACGWPPLAAGPAPPVVHDSTRAARLCTHFRSATSRAPTRMPSNPNPDVNARARAAGGGGGRAAPRVARAGAGGRDGPARGAGARGRGRAPALCVRPGRRGARTAVHAAARARACARCGLHCSAGCAQLCSTAAMRPGQTL